MTHERKTWVLRWLGFTLAAVYLAAGLTKLIALPFWTEMFEAFRLPRWSVFVVGVAELVCAGLLTQARTRPWGAMGLMVVMAGAVLARIFNGVALPLMFLDAVLFTAALWIVREQRPRFLSGMGPEGHPRGA